MDYKNPKEKAFQLKIKFLPYSNPALTGKGYLMPNASVQHENAKQCALIDVDNTISELTGLFDLGLKDVHQSISTPNKMYAGVINPRIKYWQKVKEELQKM